MVTVTSIVNLSTNFPPKFPFEFEIAAKVYDMREVVSLKIGSGLWAIFPGDIVLAGFTYKFFRDWLWSSAALVDL